MANSMSTHIHLKYEEKQIELNVYQIWLFNKNEWTLWIFRYHFISFNSGVNTIVSSIFSWTKAEQVNKHSK